MKRNVYVIGDSVSIHYGPYLKAMIKDKLHYDRKRGMEQALEDLDRPIGANAGDSSMVLEYLMEEKQKGVKYDILLFNCGLHDIRIDRTSRVPQTKLEQYKKNLKSIIEISKVMSRKCIWIGLTPVVDEIHNSRKEGFLRYSKDAHAYDAAAKVLMKEYNIECIDMYNFIQGLGENIYSDHVHFSEEIRKLQGAFIAGFLNSVCNRLEDK